MTKRIVLGVLLVLLGARHVCGQVSVPAKVELREEGSSLSRVGALNCVGSTITCTTSGDVGTLTVAGGAGSFALSTVEVDVTAAVSLPVASVRWFFHTETTLQGAPAAPAGNLTISDQAPEQTDAATASQAGGHNSTSSGVATALLNKPTTKDETGSAGEAPTTNPPAVAHRFGWFSDRTYTGAFAASPWMFQWREDDNNVGLVGHPVINLYAMTTRDFAGTVRFLGQLHGSTDWWAAGTNAIGSWVSDTVGPFTLTNEYLFVQLWCHETASFSGGQTLGFNQEGSDLLDAQRSWLVSAPFTSSQGVSARYSGSFDITGLSGLTTGRPVLVSQASGPYTNKGTREDEAEMDLVTATGVVLNTTTIRVFWVVQPHSGPVIGNLKFSYIVG